MIQIIELVTVVCILLVLRGILHSGSQSSNDMHYWRPW